MKLNFYGRVCIFTTLVSLITGKNHCPSACRLALSSVIFPDVDASLGYYPTQCGSRLRVASVYVCLRQYCRQTSVEDGRRRLNEECERYANITLPPVSIVEKFSDRDIEKFRHFERYEYDNAFEADNIVIPNRELFHLALRSKDAWSDSVRTRTQYAFVMFYFWLSVVVIGIAYRISSRRQVSAIHTHRNRSRISLFLKRWLLVPATFSTRCAEPHGWCIVPPRLQSTILLTFGILNVVLCCVGYEVFDGNLNWPVSVQWSRYIADRTGVISIANLPLVWLFATRNNLILSITGWSFETAMQFHRWVARISTIEAIVHSLAYTIIVFQTGSWAEYIAYWQMRYWIMGGMATVAMSSICVLSIYPMRHRFYELFLLIHISLGVLTLLGMWYHVEIFDGGYNWYIWPCILIWLFDRIGRAYRLVHVNYGTTLSSLEYSHDSNTVWLTVPNNLKRKPRPGEYYFLYLLKDHTFYESHPFTLNSWDESGLHFLVRPYNGFTEHLARIGQSAYSATGKTSTSCKVRVLAEGPYGATSDLRSFDYLVFVVGGTGIAVTLAYLTDLCEDVTHGAMSYQAKSIKIIWAVQHEAIFRQVYERQVEAKLNLIGKVLGPDVVHIDLEVYITRGLIAPCPDLRRSDDALLPTTLLSNESKIGANRHESTTLVIDQVESEVEEVASEHSPLLLSSTRNLALESYSKGSGILQGPQCIASGTHHSSKVRVPDNTSLIIYHFRRPDVKSLILEACFPDHDDPITLHPNSVVDATDQFLTSDNSDRNRTAVVCCGPSSLADATRAAVVEALSRESTDRIEFINESYSW